MAMATECFFSFDIFEKHSEVFSGCYCVVGMLTVHLSTKLMILFVMFLKYVFFLCLFLMRFLVAQIFLYFRTLCGWLTSFDVFIVVPFINSTRLAIIAEVDLRCGDFLSEKSCHKLVVSTNFWSWP